MHNLSKVSILPLEKPHKIFTKKCVMLQFKLRNIVLNTINKNGRNYYIRKEKEEIKNEGEDKNGERKKS